ncbi:30S ribosomal protein S8 [Patescibacteria group bacterium]|nr:30S ribosomal protein S8 [Patescibacteria group bacterium]
MNYLVADFIIRIKNAVLANRKEVVLPYSKLNFSIGKVLVKQGFLEEIKEKEEDSKKTLVVKIKYEKRIPIFTDVTLISKPSLRVYTPAKRITEVQRRGRKTIILSTNQGVMTGLEAKKKGVGGEVLFAIW